MKKPSIFSTWMRSNLKDAYSGLITQDIDFIIECGSDYLIAEEKIYANARISPAQAITYNMIVNILRRDERFKGCFVFTVLDDFIFLNKTRRIPLSHFVSFGFLNETSYNNVFWHEDIIRYSFNYLWDGKGNPPTKKTEQEHSFVRPSNLKVILDRANIHHESIDWIFINYVTGHFAIFSEDNDGIGRLEQNILNVFSNNRSGEFGIRNPKSRCVYQYLGHYNISYNLDINGNITDFLINGNYVSLEEGIELLNLTTRDIESYLD